MDELSPQDTATLVIIKLRNFDPDKPNVEALYSIEANLDKLALTCRDIPEITELINYLRRNVATIRYPNITAYPDEPPPDIKQIHQSALDAAVKLFTLIRDKRIV